MGRGAGGVIKENGGRGTASKVAIPSNTDKFISVLQNGNYKKMSRSAQGKLIKKVKSENKVPDVPKDYRQKEEAALGKYTSSGYQKINGELRSGKLSASTEKTVDTIDKVMQKNVLKHDIIVYRGTDGSFISDKAYISTSTSAYNAYGFAKNGNIHAYRIPKGTHCAYIGGAENELLLPRGFNINKHKIK